MRIETALVDRSCHTCKGSIKKGEVFLLYIIYYGGKTIVKDMCWVCFQKFVREFDEVYFKSVIAVTKDDALKGGEVSG